MPRKPRPQQPDPIMAINPEDVRQTTEVLFKTIPKEQIEKVEKPGIIEASKIKKKRARKTKSTAEKTKISKGYTLIITEKPQAAEKIASALGDARKYIDGGVSYFELKKDNKKIVIACAVGHLFNLTQEKGEKGWPIFNLKWEAEFKRNAWARKYYTLLKKLAQGASDWIIATDYDIEGEVIGLNIIRFIAKQQDAKRMKFSSLTKPELEHAYLNLSPTLNWGQAIAGESRHYLDWLYGINLSRALMEAIKSAGSFRIMSIGRVQGPSLNLIVTKEKQIQAFKPESYWQVFIIIDGIEFKHPKDLTKKLELIPFQNLKGKTCELKTEKTEQQIKPPAPFDLTTLQTEAYKFFGLNPAKTLQIAQTLYLAGLISYPRTSSQKIPEAINPLEIIKKLGRAFDTSLCINKKPVEGHKSDPAHPSIYPTGEFSSLTGDEKKVYELIVRRFLSCFCEPAILDNKIITALLGELRFIAKGLSIRKKAWMEVYKTKMQERELPDMQGTKIIEDSRIEEKQTQPPNRYSPASLVRELEKRNLGTKCLTGDTKIIFNNELIEIGQLFKKAEPYSKEERVEIKKLKGKIISLNKENIPNVTETTLISKRKIKEDEKIIKIETDLCDIKLTENHLVYLYDNSKIEQKSAGDIRLNDKIIGVLKDYREGEVIIESKIFNERFKNKNNEFVHKFSSKSVRGIKISKLPIRWSSSLAWILGYFYGDGSYSDKKYNGSHQVYFTTTEKKALDLLKESIKQVFGVEPYCYDLQGKYKVNCNSAIAYALITAFPNLNGKKPLDIPKEFIGDFLRGFFDADGNAHLRPLGKTKIKGRICNSFDTPRIKITLANKELIDWVSQLLYKLEIKNNINKNHSMCKGKRFDCWTILISGRERIEKFAYKVGFETYKEDILYKGLKCNSLNYKILQNSAKICLLLFKKPMKIEEIINETNLKRYEVLYALLRLFRIGIINKKRFSQAKRYIYSLKEKNLNYINYCMKVVYKKIGKDLYEIPLKEIKEIDYNGEVYDISVDESSPNFITEGNLLVHNSTRASIVETLYDRGYIKEQSIHATSLGLSLIESLEKHCPIIIDEKLTRNFEKEMDAILTATKGLQDKEKKVLDEAKDTITKISVKFKEEEKEIGRELLEANKDLREQERKENELTECPVCKKGKLRILYNKNSRRYFIGCSSYPECKTTFSLPPNGLMKSARDKDNKQKICDECRFPKLLAIRKGKRPWEFCFNPNCETRSRKEDSDN